MAFSLRASAVPLLSNGYPPPASPQNPGRSAFFPPLRRTASTQPSIGAVVSASAAGDPREVEEVAASVDNLMLSIAAKAPNADSTRIAVLACLHLADRLRSLERERKLRIATEAASRVKDSICRAILSTRSMSVATARPD